VIARFFTAIRILISPIAARNGMPYLHYLAYDARSRVPDRNTPNAGEPDRPAARSRRRRRERDEDEVEHPTAADRRV
jgi:hypothetical protein